MIPFIAVTSLAMPHGFFTRAGGVSTGPYASLNASTSGGDDPAAVATNRKRAARAIGRDPDGLLGLSQVHGSDVAIVTEPWRPGEGPRSDAMVTARRDVTLGIVTADCAPVLFADTGAGVIGAAHAGWRGAAAGVIEATIDAMLSLGADRARITAAIGPCIQQASYEVGDDLRKAVLAEGDATARFLPGRAADRWWFDLSGYCADRLASAGIADVQVVPADTFAEPDRFFSHRRRTLAGDGPIGHQLSLIGV